MFTCVAIYVLGFKLDDMFASLVVFYLASFRQTPVRFKLILNKLRSYLNSKHHLIITMSLNEQRAVANVRERKRTQKLNQAYKQLQSIIPKEPSDKMSKIHTLKLALAYIDFLNDILKDAESDDSSSSSKVEAVADQKSPRFNQLPTTRHQESPVYTINSPGCSSCHINLSPNASEEEEEDGYSQPRAKRFRSESGDANNNIDGRIEKVQSFIQTPDNNTFFSPQQTPSTKNTFYIDDRNLVTTQSTNFCDTAQIYPSYQHYNHSSTSTPTTIQTDNSQASDDITISLRDAFREYRTTKRRRYA